MGGSNRNRVQFLERAHVARSNEHDAFLSMGHDHLNRRRQELKHEDHVRRFSNRRKAQATLLQDSEKELMNTFAV